MADVILRMCSSKDACEVATCLFALGAWWTVSLDIVTNGKGSVKSAEWRRRDGERGGRNVDSFHVAFQTQQGSFRQP